MGFEGSDVVVEVPAEVEVGAYGAGDEVGDLSAGGSIVGSIRECALAGVWIRSLRRRRNVCQCLGAAGQFSVQA